MAPSPGTPLGGERAPRSPRRGPAADAGGPSAMLVDGDGAASSSRAARRVFCPVPGCPASDPTKAYGWANQTTMRAHIDAHLSGSLAGEVPSTWLQQHGRTRCLVCGLSVSDRHGVHPTCRPEARAAAVGPHPPDAGGGAALPTLATIQAGQTPTLRHVPALARHTWQQALTRALATVAHRNDERSWTEFLMLPQTVLCAPPRGGRKHRRAAAAYTLDRLQRWLDGERMSLWETRRQPPRNHPGPLSPEERRDLATSLGREGFDKKACTALQSEGLCPFNPETAKSLEALHPRSLPPAVTPLQDLPLAPEIVPELVARCLRAFPAETAPGPTGLRVQHLRDACVAGGTDALLTQLAAVVSLVSQGIAPTTIAPVLAGAGLVALPKPSGGVRPIAVGELLRRLVGKCLMASVREEARHYFWPSQVGVGVKGGAEKAVHTVRAWMQRNSSSSQKVLVKLDFANAFNCVSRQVALREVAAKFPGLARFATWCYQMPSSLRFGSFTLESQTGVQQGDPLGPLLFAAAIHPLASTLRAQGLDLAIHYLDDGVLAGDLGAVAAALAHVQQQASSMGLVLNLAKCEAVAVGGLCPADLAPHFPAALLCQPDGSPRVLHNFERPSVTPTLLAELSKPIGCWKRWLPWKTVRLACGCCGAVPASYVWCTACAVTLLGFSNMLWLLLIRWCGLALVG